MKYIEISNINFPETFKRQLPNSLFRKLENYLNKYNRDYVSDGESLCTVYVLDKNDAMRLGMDFKLNGFDYYNGDTMESISLVKKVRRGVPKNIFTNNVTGQSMTLNQYKKRTKSEIQKNYLSKAEVKKRKLLTNSELNKAISKGKINVVTMGSTNYISRIDVINYISKNENRF